MNVPNRDLTLYGEINTALVSPIITAIININAEDDRKEKELIDFKREPINLYINSMGGVVYDGLALINVMINSKTKIHTHAIGAIHSMALPIFICGSKRFAYEYSSFIYHEMGYNMNHSKIQTHVNLVERNIKLQEKTDILILKKTKLKKIKLDAVKKSHEDYYFDSDEALANKVADVIIGGGK